MNVTAKGNYADEVFDQIAFQLGDPVSAPPRGLSRRPPPEVQSERDQRISEQYGVIAPGQRAARSYWGGEPDGVVQGVLRGITGEGFHTIPTRSQHDCFAGFDGTRGEDVVTVLVCEAEDPVSPELRWEITVVGADQAVVNAVRDAIEGEKAG